MEGLGTAALDDGPTLSIPDLDVAQGEDIKAFDTRHIDANRFDFAAHRVMCVDTADPTEVVLRFVSVPGVRRDEIFARGDHKRRAWSGTHNGALSRAQRAVAPEVGIERMLRIDLETDAAAVARAQVLAHVARLAGESSCAKRHLPG